jgi:hypothetical protein
MREIHENAEGVKKESGSKNKRVRGKTQPPVAFLGYAEKRSLITEKVRGKV